MTLIEKVYPKTDAQEWSMVIYTHVRVLSTSWLYIWIAAGQKYIHKHTSSDVL